MVLLDSEGVGVAGAKDEGDNPIFTLTVLLASVLIYNSQGVLKRIDLNKLKYPFNIDHYTRKGGIDGGRLLVQRKIAFILSGEVWIKCLA